VEWLIARHLVELDEPRPSCLVCYFSDNLFTHAGVMLRENRVRSKWGQMPRYEHELTEVPAAYGNFVRFFQRPLPEQAKVFFRAFAKDLGLTEDQIKLAIASER
jgi:hypothetical protein